MNKKFRKLILPASILLATQSYGLGLGGLQVNSSLDEELKGEIPFIIDNNEEIEKIDVSVASYKDYEKVGLDKSYVPSNIKVSVVEKNGKKYIELSSLGPISEPIVSLLLVVDWSNGHLLREYTLLLDPPLFNNNQTNEYSESVQTNTYVAPEKIESQSQTNTSATRVTSNNYRGSNQVTVESGDTLWRIASRYNDGYSTPQQMMVAIFNNNPDAFLNDDMNRLKKGAMLTIPDSNQVSMISNGEAISEVKSQIQKWSRMQTEQDVSNNTGSSTADYGIELVPPNDNESSDSESSSGSSPSERINTQTMADLSKAKEELANSNLENEELSSRVKELEKIIEDQKLALTLKDSDLAQMQQQIKEEKDKITDANINQDATEDSGQAATDDVWDETDNSSAELSDSNTLADTQDNDTDMAESSGDKNSEMIEENNDMSDDLSDTSESTEGDNIADDSMEDNRDSESDSDTVVIEDIQVKAVEEPVEQPVVTTPVKTERSFMDKIMDYKTEGLIGLGAILLGLLGLFFFKRNSNDDLDTGGFLDSIATDESDDAIDELNSPLDNQSTELDLTNLEDFDELDEDESQEDLDEEPEVLVMDDNSDMDIDNSEEISELDDDLDDLEELDLDLDLSNDITDEVTKEAEDITELSADLDDLNLDKEVTEDSETEDTDDLSLDFDLDDLELDEDSGDEFDLDDSTEEVKKVTDDAEELDDLVFDTGERTIVDAVDSINETIESTVDDVAAEESSDELEDLEFDLSDESFNADDLDLDMDEDADSELDLLDTDEDKTELNLETLTEDDLTLDFDDIDVTEEDMADAEETEDSAEVELDSEEDVDIGLDFDDLAADDAIDTKLDLAKAYYEMGDIDGAQQMVNEIIEEGNDEQRSKAEVLKSEIEGS